MDVRVDGGAELYRYQGRCGRLYSQCQLIVSATNIQMIMRLRVAYVLGIDLGTTFTAAATFDGNTSRMVGLGNRALQIPSVLHLRPGEAVLVGEAAERRGRSDPEHLVREFKRRLGDPVPILVAGTPYSAESLTARLLRWVVERSIELLGESPSDVTLTYPAHWGAYKLDFLRQAAELADLETATICTEPQAAAVEYASTIAVRTGACIAVYDLGGGTFDICLFDKTADGFMLLGQPEGIEHLGGVDFDEAVFQVVLSDCGVNVGDLNFDDPAIIADVRQLRRDCVDAKEALSFDVEAVIPVTLGELRRSVRLTRAEFEESISPALQETIQVTRNALRSAGLRQEDLTTLVLVGGSSRIPLVSQLLLDAFQRQPSRDAHPKHNIALGAARIGASPGAARALVTRPMAASSPAEPAHIDASPGAARALVTRPMAASSPAEPAVGGPTVGDPVTTPLVVDLPAADYPSNQQNPNRPPLRRRRTLAYIGLGLCLIIVSGIVFTVQLLSRQSSAGTQSGGSLTSTGETQSTASSPSTAPSTRQTTVIVDSRVAWYATEVVVSKGDLVSLTSTGTISDDGARYFGSDGLARNPSNDPHDSDPYVAFHHGGLIGRIGTVGAPFFVGLSQLIEAPIDGTLYLRINDAILGDNDGVLTVQVTVTE
jgi:molecular chaperone DnaK